MKKNGEMLRIKLKMDVGEYFRWVHEDGEERDREKKKTKKNRNMKGTNYWESGVIKCTHGRKRENGTTCMNVRECRLHVQSFFSLLTYIHIFVLQRVTA